MDILSIILALFVVCGASFFMGSYFDAMWLPTKRSDYDRIAKLSKLKSGMTFCDLGSGSSNLLFYLAEKYRVNCVGIEIAPFWYLFSKIKSLFYNNVKIKYGNFYNQDISQVDVVYVYLLPRTYEKVKNKVVKELKIGGKLIISSWPLQNVDTLYFVYKNQKNNSPTYYLYEKKP